ncbi:MAG: hypothetical protein IPJ98_17880 [Bryobacterales bacterium]|nr:hypothetical protein [Bryobacterales bacterium]
MKEKVWLVIHYSKSFYRANDLPQAERIVEKCADVLKRFVETQDDPCHRTWGYLEYTRGQIRRQRLDYDRSTDAMQACLWHARAKLEWFEDQPQQETPRNGPSGARKNGRGPTPFGAGACLGHRLDSNDAGIAQRGAPLCCK